MGLGILVEQARSWRRQLVKTLAKSLAHTQSRWTSTRDKPALTQRDWEKHTFGPGRGFLPGFTQWTQNPRFLWECQSARHLFYGFPFCNSSEVVGLFEVNRKWRVLLRYLFLGAFYVNDKDMLLLWLNCIQITCRLHVYLCDPQG